MNIKNLFLKSIIAILFTCILSTSFFSFTRENGHFIEFGQEAKAETILYNYNKYNVVVDPNVNNNIYTLNLSLYNDVNHSYTFFDIENPYLYYRIFAGSYCYRWDISSLYKSYTNIAIYSESHYLKNDSDYSPVFCQLKGNALLKGALVTSNVEAADGTYPDDGKHTDGYWYVKMGLANIKPTITSTTQGNETFSTVQPNMTISGTINDADNGDIITAKYRVDGSAGQVGTTITTVTSDTTAKPYSTTIYVGSLSEGTHIVYQWAEDNKGGKSAEIATTFYVDKSSPVTATPLITANSTSQLTVIGNAADPLVSGAQAGLDTTPYQFNRDNTDLGTWQGSSYIDTGLASNTQYTYKYKARDKVGNISGYSTTASAFTLAEIPVSASIISTTSTSASILLIDTAANGIVAEHKFEVKPVGGGANVAQSGWTTETAITLSGLTDNIEYELWVTTRNGDNVENAPVKMIANFRSNTTPNISVENINVTASAIIPFNTVTMSGIVFDPDNELVTVKVTIDGVTKSVVVNPAPTSNPGIINWTVTFDGSELSEGSYTNIPITAVDSKGGISTTNYTGTIVIDKTGPSATPTLTASSILLTTSAITVTADNFGDAVHQEYRIDGGTWMPYTGSIEVNNNCLIEARGLDEYGNQSGIGSITVGNIDRDPPTAPTINLSDASWTTASAVTVEVVDGIDLIGGVDKSQLKVGSGGWSDYTTPVSITSEGITTVAAITIDTLGNTSAVTNAQVKIDRTMPVIRRIYIENGTLYIVAQDNLGLNTTPYKFKLKSTTTITDVEAVESSSDPFQLSLLIESDRDLRDQSTVWISSNYLTHAKLGDVYVIYIKDQANNTVSQQITVNKTSGTLFGELSPEELAAQNQNDDNSSSGNSPSQPPLPESVPDTKKDSDEALSEVVTIADNTPVNSGTGQITVDLSSMIDSMSKRVSLANCKYRLELTEKKTGYLVYSKVLTDTKKIVIPDLDDATTYIVKVAIIDGNGSEINTKSFEQSTPDRTPPIIAALKTKDGVLTVDAKDNVMLAGEAYRYELVSMNINTASTDKKFDADAINRIKATFDNVAKNEWNFNTWTSKNQLENVEVNMVIKTIVKDKEGNTAEQIIVVEKNPKEYVNLLNPDNPYILDIGLTGNITAYFGSGDFEYSSSDETIASVDSKGIIKGVKKGETIITAKDKKTGDVKQILVKVRNVNAINLRRIIVEKDSQTNLVVLYKDQLLNLLGTSEGIVWTSQDSSIASVDNTGIALAHNNGLTKITAVYQNKKIDVYVIVATAGSLKSDIQHISVTAPFVIKAGSNVKMLSILKCINFNDKVTNPSSFTVFESSDDEIVSVKDGILYANKAGTVEITAIDLINNVYSKVKVCVADITPKNITFKNEGKHWAEKYMGSDLAKTVIDGEDVNGDSGVSSNEFLTALSKTLLLKNDTIKSVDRESFNYTGLSTTDINYNYSADILSQIYNVYGYKIFGDAYKGEATLTRGQVAEIILALTKGKLKKKVSKYYFTDLKDSPNESALRYCIESGIMNGCGYNKIVGDKAITKAEMIVVLTRLSEVLK